MPQALREPETPGLNASIGHVVIELVGYFSVVHT